MGEGHRLSGKLNDENETGKIRIPILPYCAQVAKCIPGRTGPTRQASQSGLKEDVGRWMGESYRAPRKHRDEDETGKIKNAHLHIMQRGKVHSGTHRTNQSS